MSFWSVPRRFANGTPFSALAVKPFQRRRRAVDRHRRGDPARIDASTGSMSRRLSTAARLADLAVRLWSSLS
jgi:hypothetical protein